MNLLRSAILATSALVPLSGALADAQPTTPIKHVIVVVGENVSFDTLFATYTPPNKTQTVKNLLSEQIINADGTPGHYYVRAQQNKAAEPGGKYMLTPPRVGAYASLPQPLMIGILDPTTLTFAKGVPDKRYPTGMKPGPYQITNDKVKYSATFASETGDPVHRFFQMWQQTGGANTAHDLFLWTATSTGTGGSNGSDGPTPKDTQQGGELMGFFNMAKGDAPTFKALADGYALADNFHQGVMGGTGMNFFALATGDLPVYTRRGKLATPPTNQIENPDPRPGTVDFFKEDGYSGGSWVKCSDATQPGVAAIHGYLAAIKRAPNCVPGAYHLVNNYGMPYDVHGTPRLDIDNNPIVVGGKPLASPFTLPAQSVPTIGEALSAKKVSWKWYTGGRDAADITSDPIYPLLKSKFPVGTPDAYIVEAVRAYFYNDIGDPMNASKNVVGNPALFGRLQGVSSFYADLAAHTLPAVSFVVPKNLDSGHPGYSVPAKYELFIADLVARVQAQPEWKDTAIIVTADEGGGYFDSGVNQTLDFFGDGSRIPMIVVSPWAKKGQVDHTYYDHVSILKFIEKNWNVPPLSSRSRDRLPNPKVGQFGSYLPSNAPAIGDLMNMFDFAK